MGRGTAACFERGSQDDRQRKKKCRNRSNLLAFLGQWGFIRELKMIREDVNKKTDC